MGIEAGFCVYIFQTGEIVRHNSKPIVNSVRAKDIKCTIRILVLLYFQLKVQICKDTKKRTPHGCALSFGQQWFEKLL